MVAVVVDDAAVVVVIIGGGGGGGGGGVAFLLLERMWKLGSSSSSIVVLVVVKSRSTRALSAQPRSNRDGDVCPSVTSACMCIYLVAELISTSKGTLSGLQGVIISQKP